MCSLGELLIPTVNGFRTSRHVSRGAKLVLRRTPTGVMFYTLSLPWTKTTANEGLALSLADNGDRSSPVTALTRHLTVNTGIPSSAPFFAYRTKTGWSPLTREWFLKHCNQVWQSAGIQTLTGHSFRIGGTTELLLRGTPPDVVAAQGGWRSKSFLDYWRRIDVILPLFISDSFAADRLALVRRNIAEFRSKHS